jgi:hypothetical protein
MKKSLEKRLAALCEINRRYQKFIDSDPILKQDFASLIECSRSSDAMTLQHYKKIINHLIAESNEAAEDNQRMAYESPMYLPDQSDASKHLQERRALKSALDNYQERYMID